MVPAGREPSRAVAASAPVEAARARFTSAMASPAASDDDEDGQECEGKENRSPRQAVTREKGSRGNDSDWAGASLSTSTVVAKQLQFQHITVRRGRFESDNNREQDEKEEETKGDDSSVRASASVLGKRPLVLDPADDDYETHKHSRTTTTGMGNAWCSSDAVVAPASQKVSSSFVSITTRPTARISAASDEDDALLDEIRLLGEISASADVGATSQALMTTTMSSGQGVTINVNELATVPLLSFGAVPVGSKRSLQLRLTNPSELGHARIKYEGYALIRSPATSNSNGGANSTKHKSHARFKCDLHVCVVDAEKSVQLRVTFEPLESDLNREVKAELRFAVNDKFKLRCKATGSGAPRVANKSRFGRRSSGSFEPTVEVSVPKPRPASTPAITDREGARVSFAPSVGREGEPDLEPDSHPGSKRRGGLMLEFSPTRRRHNKRRRSDLPAGGDNRTLAEAAAASLSSSKKSVSRKPFGGSWWMQRKEFYDENWMAKQEEGFTKWINYVLTDATNQRMADDLTENSGNSVEIALAQTRALSDKAKSRLERRRANFSSLRLLAMKRMQAKWSTAALNIYHSPSMGDILFELQEEIANKKLLVRADRPVYADVGLQEELISLLNNYHPVWLCLGLEAVLGAPVLKHEKCSLRHIFSSTTGKAPPRKNDKRKMPQALRQVVLNHLVKDSQIAKKFRLVRNLKLPIDGSVSANDGGNGFTSNKKRINGREYYDALMETFILKFLMLVLFLDHAIEQRSDTFVHFPCLFRITQTPSGNKGDEKQQQQQQKQPQYPGTGAATNVKKSQLMVTEFCRFFLAAEGRIDKHLKQLGYVLKHEQMPLNEMNLEVKNLAVDLRDGIILAKLMEVLTASPSASQDTADAADSQQLQEASSDRTQKLSSFLRIPALSRLQKVHNIEICLNYLQDKCGASILEDVKSRRSMTQFRNAQKLKGRVRMSSSGFASLRTKVDEKLLEQLAKDIVDGHREKTLALLWRLISCFQLQSLVDNDAMANEIDRVLSRMSFRARDFFDLQQHEAPLRFPEEDQVYSLLLQWCRAVCANYLVEVHDFTTSFADGKVLCYLMHYYHPMLLSKSEVTPTLADLHANGDEADQDSEQTLLANERRHFALVNARVKQLGEIPVMMPQYYSSKNPPEEKMVVTFVCYLQSRLMESSKEIHAASRLKRWWLSPLIRLKMRRKKNKCARIIQRFWYTSSAKRLAIRQCRKLLRAGDMVKSLVRGAWQRKLYVKTRRAVVTLQRSFRRKQRLLGRQNEEATAAHTAAAFKIQMLWRKHATYKAEVERLAREVDKQRKERRMRMKKGCLKIEQAWWNYVMRTHARRWRRNIIHRRQRAVHAIQSAWQRYSARAAARQSRREDWANMRRAAWTIQCAWRRHCRIQRERQRQQLQFEHARAATQIQCVYRGYHQRQTYLHQLASVVMLQRNVCIWRRRRQVLSLAHFYDLLVKYQRMKQREREFRLWELKSRVQVRAARTIQQMYRYVMTRRYLIASATKIQTVVRGHMQYRRYQLMRASAALIQRNYHLLRRRRQLGALVYFYGMLERYQNMQRNRAQQLQYEHEKRVCLLRRKIENRAAYRIQMALRFFVHRKHYAAATAIQTAFRAVSWRRQFVAARVAAVTIQKNVRGWLSRRYRMDYYALRMQLAQLRVLMACWQIENWYSSRMHRYRRRRTLMVRARWTRMSAHIVETRTYRANAIASCWQASRLRREISSRIEAKRSIQMRQERAAVVLQHWWVRMWWKQHTRQRLAEAIRHREGLKVLREKVERRSRQAIGQWLYDVVVVPRRKERAYGDAIRRVQSWWRGTLVRVHEKNPALIKHRKKLATMPLVVSDSGHADSEQREQEKKKRDSLGGGALRVPLSKSRAAEESTTRSTAKPMTLGARFEMALHLLLHGKRLQEMLFASHTIEMCTRYSRECCFKCVELRISNTIFAAIRGLNRSRPHVELLHQLLRVLVNLTTYQQEHPKERKATTPRAKKPKWTFAAVANMSSAAMAALAAAVSGDEDDDAVKDEVRAVETIVDLLHIHRDMHHVFVLSARVLRHYLLSLRSCIETMREERERSSTMDEDEEEEERRRLEVAEGAWRDADHRLRSLMRLLQSKAALYEATEATRSILEHANRRMAGGNGANDEAANTLMRKMNPKTAVTIMTQLLTLME